MKPYLFLGLAVLALGACNRNGNDHDATGTFEATEVIVSAEVAGKIQALQVTEGEDVAAGKVVGAIESTVYDLQRAQAEATLSALNDRTVDPNPQIAILKEQETTQNRQLAVQQEQINSLDREKKRVENLFKSKAATQKQLDDITSQYEIALKQAEALKAQIAVIKQQIASQKQAADIQNRGILSERKPMQERIAQLSDQLSRTQIKNPVKGTVLIKYAQVGEVTGAGKALYKVANLDTMTLRAYITGEQLAQIKIGQTVTVTIDGADVQPYQGTISWVANKAEFTPKSVQTKDERANLVYAVKIRVKNDGRLKIGMPADVKF